jgi:signal peptidase II
MSLTIGEHSRLFFSMVATIAVIVLGAMYRKTDSKATVTVLALAMVMGGAVGNLLDRVRSGRGVVDFIDLGVGDIRFWTFNVADIGVSIGAVLLAWQLSKSPSEPASGQASASP